MTIREIVFVRLVTETVKFLDMKAIPFGKPDSGHLKVQRGIIRGLSLAITKMWGNGYEPYWAREVKDCEKSAVRLAKEVIGERERGSRKWPDDGWWAVRRRDFWRSGSDAQVRDQS